MITIGYDFRIDADGKPQPTMPNFYPGLWHLLSADWLFSAQPGLSARMPGFVELFSGNAGLPWPVGIPWPAAHRMLCLDLEGVAEPFQRTIALAFMRELRRVTQAKCLIIGGAWPGHGPSRVWNDAKVMEQLSGFAPGEMFALLREQLPLYKAAGVMTYYIGADKPSDFEMAIEKVNRIGLMLGSAAPGLERCLWLSGHYGPGGNNAEWTPDECARVLDAAWDLWDSVAVHHGLTVGNNLANEISRRLA